MERNRSNAKIFSNSAGSTFGFCLIVSCAHDDDVVVIADFAFHELRKLVAGNRVPIVQPGIDAVSSQLGSKLFNPRLLRVSSSRE